MKKMISQIIFALIFTFGVFAQESGKLETVTHFPMNAGMEIWELNADIFGNELQKYPNSIGFIEVYGTGKGFDKSDFSIAARFKNYLTKVKGISPERIAPKVCTDEDEGIKLTIMPQNYDYKSCSETIELNSNETFHFATYGYGLGEDLRGCCRLEEFDKEAAEATIKAASEAYKKLNDSEIYLIAYTCKKCNAEGKDDSPKVADKMLREATEAFVKNGIDKTKISTRKSKSKERRVIEIYFVPKDGEIPKPKPNYFPKKKK